MSSNSDALAAYVASVVAKAPPLTPDQSRRVAALLAAPASAARASRS
ncbi:hypothetical protein RN607_03550 [Demequina capsici]|uniref:Uncharacterized protein n=1 Tax=Demequina capsici TaxID=3075620 RepID=A0AA96FEG3_9MICO|nr:hypothetical protein [Demequina sp. PMTSA13]WNM28090.1 hypothetical protein RN607_03550 [Demequina sp. PMTSA13]